MEQLFLYQSFDVILQFDLTEVYFLKNYELLKQIQKQQL